jgi:undecaprenyl-diphosphatase
MPDWVETIVLGVIEGVTEFLPISSTGHLLIVQNIGWVGRRPDLFNVGIQSGAVLSVVFIFTERLRQLLFQWRESAARDYLLKLVAAFAITGAGGLALKAADFQLPETAGPVIAALIGGGVLFLGIEHWLKGRALRELITWPMAAAIGLAQLAAAVFPGLSRSGATILVALMLGLNRRLAIEFTFLLGIPTLLAAGGLEVADHLGGPDGAGVDWGGLALGTAASAVTAFVAVKWLLRFVQSHTFVAFGWYRIGLGLVLLALGP